MSCNHAYVNFKFQPIKDGVVITIFLSVLLGKQGYCESIIIIKIILVYVVNLITFFIVLVVMPTMPTSPKVFSLYDEEMMSK
jgi:hypothetical protein